MRIKTNKIILLKNITITYYLKLDFYSHPIFNDYFENPIIPRKYFYFALVSQIKY